MWKNIICRFGVPHAFISDNGPCFKAVKTMEFCERLGIKNNFTSVSKPSSNGLTENANRTIKEGLVKKIEGRPKRWAFELHDILWAYRVTPREATGKSPYELVYGSEPMTPLEMLNDSLRVRAREESSFQGNAEERALDLDIIDETRNEAQFKMAEYQRRIKRAFDKNIAPRHFQPGDLVLRLIEATGASRKKLDRIWDGPFKVVASRGNGAYKLETLEGYELPRTWNALHLRKFYH